MYKVLVNDEEVMEFDDWQAAQQEMLRRAHDYTLRGDKSQPIKIDVFDSRGEDVAGFYSHSLVSRRPAN